jgi:hypothetical protein
MCERQGRLGGPFKTFEQWAMLYDIRYVITLLRTGTWWGQKPKIHILRDVVPCRLVNSYRRFGEVWNITFRAKQSRSTLVRIIP